MKLYISGVVGFQSLINKYFFEGQIIKRLLNLLFFTVLFSFSQAAFSLTVSDLAVKQNTKVSFHLMAKNHSLPKWVTSGGVDSPAQEVVITGEKYVVLSSCKPHDCASQSIAVLYSPKSGELAGLLSTVEKKTQNQNLIWLNITDDLSIDGKTILFSALSGSLQNHPTLFNFE